MLSEGSEHKNQNSGGTESGILKKEFMNKACSSSVCAQKVAVQSSGGPFHSAETVPDIQVRREAASFSRHSTHGNQKIQNGNSSHGEKTGQGSAPGGIQESVQNNNKKKANRASRHGRKLRGLWAEPAEPNVRGNLELDLL